MDDKKIMKFCAILVVIGIIGLFIVTTFSAPTAISISSIDENSVGQIVSISGTVTSYYTSDGHVFMDIDDTTGVIKVVMFEEESENNPWVYDVRKDDEIIVNGKIQLYKGELEIIAKLVAVV
jgi:aspartyl/asparaginyl-tRNA synthetase